MNSSYNCFRGYRIRNLWVCLSCFLLFLGDYVDLLDHGERFCLAGSVNEGHWHQNVEKVEGSRDQTSEEGRFSTGNTVVRLPLRRFGGERVPSLGDIVFSSFEERSLLDHQSEPSAQIYFDSNTGVRPEPVASIPVCVKPSLELLLKHAFDILVHNQHLYLSMKERKKARNRPLEYDIGNSAEKQRVAGTQRSKDELDSGQVPEAGNFLQERLTEEADMRSPTSVGEQLRSMLFSRISPRERGRTNSNNEKTSRGTRSSSSAQESRANAEWYRNLARLVTPQRLQRMESHVAGVEGLEQMEHFLQNTALLSAHLPQNLKLLDLPALLQTIGRMALPNEPEDAVVYLTFLLQDREALTLWRDHSVRHVCESFTFTSCDTAKTSTTFAAEGEAEEREEIRALKEREDTKKKLQMQEAKQTERKKKPAKRKQMNFPFFQWLRNTSESSGGPSGAKGDNEHEREETAERNYEDENEEQRRSTRVRGGAKDDMVEFMTLLGTHRKGLQDFLLKELQKQFWMSRPASSTAAAKMIQRATEHVKKEHVDEEEGEDGTKHSSEEKPPRVWTPALSPRFRYMSLKDAQRIMGTFLTSNIHPEYGFPMGTKLPPQETQRRNKRSGTAAGARIAEEVEEEEGEAWQEETVQRTSTNSDETELDGTAEDKEEESTEERDEKEEKLPEQFDAREAFPKCKDIIGHVRDQGNCGSCWAFSSTTSFNDRLCIKSGGEMQQLLSPQHTTSCCDALLCASFGCNGGEPGLAWRWFQTEGVVSGGDYETLRQGKTCWPYEIPYCNHHSSSPFPDCQGDGGDTNTPQCRSECEEEEYTRNIHPFNKDLHRASRAFSFPTREHAKRDIMRAGSISAAFMVYEDFLNYQEGVYKHVYGLPIGGHAVKIIGWGIEGGEEYWLVVNSWNSYWGEKGLVKFRMGEAGIDEDLLAGDVVWKPELQTKLVEEEKLSDADDVTSAAEPSTVLYREL